MPSRGQMMIGISMSLIARMKNRVMLRDKRWVNASRQKTIVTIDRNILGRRCRRWQVFSLARRLPPVKMLP